MKRIVRTLIAAGMVVLVSACGRKGALIYPDMMVPAAPATVTALQSGTAVKLRFTLPDKDRAGRALNDLAGVRISKRTIVTDQKEVCRSCLADFMLFQTIYLDRVPLTTQRFGSVLVVLDGDVNAGNSYSYRVVPFTTASIDGAAFVTADVRVTRPLPAPVLKIESFPTEVRLHITSQSLMAGHVLGYNLYRWPVAGIRPYQPLTKEPLLDNEYVDAGLERGVKYRYAARMVISTEAGGIAESTESLEGEGMLKDDE